MDTDCASNILHYVDVISTWLSIIRVSTTFYNTSLKFPKKIFELENRTKTLLKSCPEFKWLSESLSYNKNIRITDIHLYPGIKWELMNFFSNIHFDDYQTLINLCNDKRISIPSHRPPDKILTIDSILDIASDGPDGVHKNILSSRPDLSIKHINRMGNDYWDWYKVSETPNKISPLEYPELPWSIEGLTLNRTFTLKEIKELQSRYPGEVNWKSVCVNTPMTMQEFLDNVPVDKFFDQSPKMYGKRKSRKSKGAFPVFIKYGKLTIQDAIFLINKYKIHDDFCENNNISPWDILNSGIPINLEKISTNTKIDIEFVLYYHRKNRFTEFNRSDLSLNPGISIHDIMKYKHLRWDENIVSYRSDVTIEIVLANKGFNWNWANLSKNTSITTQNIIQNKQLPWDMKVLSRDK